MWVFDATPLIYLAKANRLHHLESLEGPRFVPERIYDEVVVDGIENDYPDARRIEIAVENGVFERVAVDETEIDHLDDETDMERLEAAAGVSDADVAVLALAVDREATAVMDDQYGRDIADVEGVPTRGTAYLLVRLARDGRLSTDEARRSIDEMIEAGWYCSPDLYAKVRRKLDAID